MKAFTTIVALLVTVAAARGLPRAEQDDKLPKCAKQCTKEHWKVSGCDSKKDYECLCKSKPFHQEVVPCVKQSCNEEEKHIAMQWVKETCHYSVVAA